MNKHKTKPTWSDIMYLFGQRLFNHNNTTDSTQIQANRQWWLLGTSSKHLFYRRCCATPFFTGYAQFWLSALGESFLTTLSTALNRSEDVYYHLLGWRVAKNQTNFNKLKRNWPKIKFSHNSSEDDNQTQMDGKRYIKSRLYGFENIISLNKSISVSTT